MDIVKSTSLDIKKFLKDNLFMSAENKKHNQVAEVVNMWKEGDKFEQEGYGDLGFTLKDNAIKMAMKLTLSARKIIADILFPIKQ